MEKAESYRHDEQKNTRPGCYSLDGAILTLHFFRKAQQQEKRETRAADTAREAR